MTRKQFRLQGFELWKNLPAERRGELYIGDGCTWKVSGVATDTDTEWNNYFAQNRERFEAAIAA